MSGIATAAGIGVGGIAQGYAAKQSADASGRVAKEQARVAELGLQENRRQFDITNPQQQEQFAQTRNLATQAQNIGVENEAARRAAYKGVLGSAGQQLTSGEEGFMGAVNQENPYLSQVAKDIGSQGTESMTSSRGQLQAGLVQQGVRGGQAAAQIAQQMGTMGIQQQRDLNKLKMDESAQRAADKRAYLAAKAARGQAGTLQTL